VDHKELGGKTLGHLNPTWLPQMLALTTKTGSTEKTAELAFR
jgi:hypothetical protein